MRREKWWAELEKEVRWVHLLTRHFSNGFLSLQGVVDEKYVVTHSGEPEYSLRVLVKVTSGVVLVKQN